MFVLRGCNVRLGQTDRFTAVQLASYRVLRTRSLHAVRTLLCMRACSLSKHVNTILLASDSSEVQSLSMLESGRSQNAKESKRVEGIDWG